MNYGALLPSPYQTPPLSSLAIEKLRRSVRQQLPLQFQVASSVQEKTFVVYNCDLSNVATGNSWSVSYRYSEFAAFSKKIETQCTCFDARCCGSCEAIREFLWVCFPSKRLSSRSTRTIADRKRKFETVVQYLLRCVLLPGSAMKCLTARQNLPTVLFDFLGVRNEADKRSVLQVFVDNYRIPSRCSKPECRDSFNSDTSTTDSMEALQCMVCLEEVEVEPPSSSITLPCQHTFHRECIFEWLLFQFHCPMCRARIGPPASASYCIERNTIFQWWLCNFEEDPLAVVKQA